MKPSHCLLFPVAALSFSLPARADTVSGTIVNHSDVVQIPITLTEQGGLTIWTTSFGSGGFDPIVTLWFGGSLVGYNDDAFGALPGQGRYDSILREPNLAPGDYLLTVSSYNNFANGGTLAEGFLYDGATPIPIEQWSNLSGNYSVHWSIGPVSTIPEPSSAMMLLAGLGIAAFVKRRYG